MGDLPLSLLSIRINMEWITSIFIAVGLDLYLGEPKRWHPLIFFGRLASVIEHHFLKVKFSGTGQKIMGIVALILLLTVFSLPLYYLQQFSLFNGLVAPIILYFCIAANSLKQHAVDVLQALDQGDLNLARKKVAMIVSRDCSQMDELAVRRATLESVLENGADAIFAPLFWFMIGGAAGVVIYRICNTLDAMWGYKNARYVYFGWAAARLDDGLNFIPARLTALSYILWGQKKLGWQCWKTQAKLLESPNGGVVMTAGAGSLNVQLGGGAFYQGVYKDKPLFGSERLPENKDIERANHLIDLTLVLWGGLLLLGALFLV
ncbi:MAG: adenosylcobinamide-phosphate synthase CbiB [Methylococcales bacterium]|nr:adenosylcobinamide-phosphate synthase CbiB [Methylococcales bacterium]